MASLVPTIGPDQDERTGARQLLADAPLAPTDDEPAGATVRCPDHRPWTDRDDRALAVLIGLSFPFDLPSQPGAATAGTTSTRPDATVTNIPAPLVAVESGTSAVSSGSPRVAEVEYWEQWLAGRVATMSLRERSHDDSTVPAIVLVLLAGLVAVLSFTPLFT